MYVQYKRKAWRENGRSQRRIQCAGTLGNIRTTSILTTQKDPTQTRAFSVQEKKNRRGHQRTSDVTCFMHKRRNVSFKGQPLVHCSLFINSHRFLKPSPMFPLHSAPSIAFGRASPRDAIRKAHQNPNVARQSCLNSKALKSSGILTL